MQFLGVSDKDMHTIITWWHNEAIEKLKTWLIDTSREEYVNKLYDLDDRLKVELSNRLAICAGKARIKSNTISISYRLHKGNNDQLIKTYGHELAHMVARMLDPACKPHGALWKSVSRAMGQEPERCHSMDVSPYRRKVKRYVYKCQCREWTLTQAKHNKARKYVYNIYSCPKCKSDITYASGPFILDRSK